jgi:hypothetical protein
VNITVVCIPYVSSTGERCVCVKHLFVLGLFDNAVSVLHYRMLIGELPRISDPDICLLILRKPTINLSG